MTSPEGFYDCNGAASGLNKSDISGGCCLPGEQTCNKCFYTKLECENEFGCDTSATNQGCGCNEPAPGACGCNRPNLTCNTPPKTLLDSINCACVCPTTCLAGQTQNSTTCACSCPTTCPAGQTQNSTTCACGCSASPACTVPKTKTLANSCACSCPKNKPHNVNGQCSVCPKNQKLRGGKCITPTATPTCNYYAVKFNHKTGESVTIDKTDAPTLSCFNKIIASARAETAKIGGRPVNPDTTQNGNNQIYAGLHHGTAGWFTSMLWEALKKHNGLSNILEASERAKGDKVGDDWLKHVADNDKAKEAINCTGQYVGVTQNGEWQIGGAYSGGYWVNRGEVGCKSGSLYLDKNCKFVDADTVIVDADTVKKSNQCGSINYEAAIATPISLIWSEDYKTEASTLVGFKLDPHSDTNTWLWRGSESLPLLVYDPEHKGMIDSATQLFGSWTFGGNGLASLIEGTERGTPWKDGYEALSKMDKDLDGKVSGDELKDLGLWFDKNRDGISQSGEVKTLSEVSVNALYYKADKTEKGAIIATKGYDREVDGQTVVASSMDWSEKGLKDGLGVLLENLNDGASKNTKLIKDNDKPINSEHAKEVAPEVYGVWAWETDRTVGSSNGSGILSFDPSEQGITGATITQLGMSGMAEVSSQVMFSHFDGTVTKNTEGLSELKFQVQAGSGATLNNTATLSSDGTELLGKTVVTGSTTSETGSYEYTWKASKLK